MELPRYVRACMHDASAHLVRAAVFGFTAALAERIPIVGLIFSVSNRIGAAMWAHGMDPVYVSALVYGYKLSWTLS